MRSKPTINKFADRAELASALAARVRSQLEQAVELRGTAFLAVSGGSTPGPFLDALSRASLPWREIVISLVDERCVPPDHERSNARLVRERLLVGPVEAARFVPLYDPDSASPEDAAERANRALEELGSPDACILGMGMDGHTASFFAKGDNLPIALDETTERTVISMNAPGAGEPRLTLTLPLIASSSFLALHIEGEEKMAVIGEALNPGPAQSLPVRAVLDRAGAELEIYWAP